MYWKPRLTSPTTYSSGTNTSSMNTSLVRSSPIVQMPLDGDAGLVERHEHERDAAVLVVGIGAGAEPVPLGEVRRRGPRLLAVEDPTRLAVALAALGLEAHRRRVGSGVGLAVADRELHVVAQDLRQELLLQELARLLDQRLADDADALADLRAAARRERLVEEVLVHAFALGPAVLLGPGEPEPAPLADLAHEGPPLRRVDDLRHVLAGEVEDVGIVVLVEELSTSSANARCSGENSKSMRAPGCRPASDAASDPAPIIRAPPGSRHFLNPRLPPRPRWSRTARRASD